uniref:Alpha-carbonic anhydrase domain-containing protein n=1 Tax=Steinernema glaseri TaxID=37863 RepID=A0A1I7ZR36_9BILA
MEAALKQPNGVLALAILSNVLYNGSQSGMHSFKFSQMIPNSEKNKEFWVYEGSEAVEPFREDVKWIVFRAAIPISSGQLDKLRELRESRAEDEVEKKMNPMRAVQSLNSRLVRSSFRSVAQSELP